MVWGVVRSSIFIADRYRRKNEPDRYRLCSVAVCGDGGKDEGLVVSGRVGGMYASMRGIWESVVGCGSTPKTNDYFFKYDFYNSFFLSGVLGDNPQPTTFLVSSPRCCPLAPLRFAPHWVSAPIHCRIVWNPYQNSKWAYSGLDTELMKNHGRS